MDSESDLHRRSKEDIGTGHNSHVHSSSALKRLIRREEISAKCNKLKYENSLVILGESPIDRDIFEMLRSQNRMYFMNIVLQGLHRSALPDSCSRLCAADAATTKHSSIVSSGES